MSGRGQDGGFTPDGGAGARAARRLSRRLRERRLRQLHQLQWLAHMERLDRSGPPFDARMGWRDPRQRRRTLRWQLRAHHRWHQRWHRHHAHFKHSLGARLIAVFIVLAVASSLVVWGAISEALSPRLAMPLLLLMTGLAYGGIRHMVRPLSALAEGAEAFGRGELDHRVPVVHGDEIGDLALRFNQMAGSLQAMLDGKRALLLAISHELRSPLTRARLHAEMVEEGASRDALLSELGQMRDLIATLLDSERLDSGHSALQLAQCDLSALVAEQAQPGVVLDVQPGLPTLTADAVRLRLLLRNLVQNALRYNDPANGPVVVSLVDAGAAFHTEGGRGRGAGAGTSSGEGGGAGMGAGMGTGAGTASPGDGALPGAGLNSLRRRLRLTVRDHGPGVPPEAMSQLGQPFFRPDEARSRAQGGVGLGLSLCRLVAQAHGSRLELRNREPGFEASVVLQSVDHPPG